MHHKHLLQLNYFQFVFCKHFRHHCVKERLYSHIWYKYYIFIEFFSIIRKKFSLLSQFNEEQNQTNQYLGCFIENNGSVPSFLNAENTKISLSIMTLEFCYGYCVARKFALMGVYGRYFSH